MNKKIIYLAGVVIVIIIIGVIFIMRGQAPNNPSFLTSETDVSAGVSPTNGGNVSGDVSIGSSSPSITDLVAGEADPGFATRQVKGVCYIPDDSQCLEYLGTAYTPEMIKTALCTNKGAQIMKSCPASMVAGCHAMINNKDMDIISWGYASGGKPITKENYSSFAASCLMLGGLWIDPTGHVVKTPPAGV